MASLPTRCGCCSTRYSPESVNTAEEQAASPADIAMAPSHCARDLENSPSPGCKLWIGPQTMCKYITPISNNLRARLSKCRASLEEDTGSRFPACLFKLAGTHAYTVAPSQSMTWKKSMKTMRRRHTTSWTTSKQLSLTSMPCFDFLAR